jgi:hypothetical protein
MRTGFSLSSKLVAALGAAALGLASGSAWAQDQPAPAPPPGFAPPPPGFAPPPAGYVPAPGYAPPGYAPPPAGYYAPPAAGYAPPNVGPRMMDYEQGQPVPAGYHVETKARKGLAIAGGVMFGSFYILSAFGAAIASDGHDKQAWPFWVPAIGPFIALGTEKHNALRSSNDATASLTFLYVIDGIVQTGGLAMLVAGIALPSQKLVRDDIGLLDDKVHIRPSPIALGNGQYGFGFVGTM